MSPPLFSSGEWMKFRQQAWKKVQKNWDRDRLRPAPSHLRWFLASHLVVWFEEKPKLNPGFWLSTGLTAPGRGTTRFNGIVLPIGEHPDREKGRSCENVDHQVVTGGTRGSKGSP